MAQTVCPHVLLATLITEQLIGFSSWPHRKVVVLAKSRLKTLLFQTLFLHSHLCLAQTHVLEFDSHWRW